MNRLITALVIFLQQTSLFLDRFTINHYPEPLLEDQILYLLNILSKFDEMNCSFLSIPSRKAKPLRRKKSGLSVSKYEKIK